MVASKNYAYLDLISEDFKGIVFSKEHPESSLNAEEILTIEENIKKRINSAMDIFDANVNVLESEKRIIDWDSFNRMLVILIRRSSVKAQDDWKKDKFKRHRERKKYIAFFKDYNGKKSSDIPTHLKMELIDFLVYGKSVELGYVLGSEKFISEYKAINFLAKLFWALGLDQSPFVSKIDDLDNNDNLAPITERLRINFTNYVRGSTAGFPISAKISSIKRSQP